MPKYNGRRVSKYLAELMKLYNGRCVFCDSEVMTVRIAQELGLKILIGELFTKKTVV